MASAPPAAPADRPLRRAGRQNAAAGTHCGIRKRTAGRRGTQCEPAGTQRGRRTHSEVRRERTAGRREHNARRREHTADRPEHTADRPEHGADRPEHRATRRERGAAGGNTVRCRRNRQRRFGLDGVPPQLRPRVGREMCAFSAGAPSRANAPAPPQRSLLLALSVLDDETIALPPLWTPVRGPSENLRLRRLISLPILQ